MFDGAGTELSELAAVGSLGMSGYALRFVLNLNGLLDALG